MPVVAWLALTVLGCGGTVEISGVVAPPTVMQPVPGLKPAPSITGVTISDNPYSVLSCIVNWTTPVPASSTVEFGDDGSPSLYSFRARGANTDLTTDHTVLLIGVHAESAVHLRAVSIDAGGKTWQSDDLIYKTLPLPPEVLPGDYQSSAPDLVQPGWTLTGYGNSQNASVAIMYDETGRVVWYRVVAGCSGPNMFTLSNDKKHIHGLFFWVSETPCPVAEFDLTGAQTWRGPAQASATRPISQMHHEFHELPNGNFATVTFSPRSEPVLGDALVEFDRSGNKVWTWDIFDHLTPEAGAPNDWTHGNAHVVDLDGGFSYFSSRNLSAIFKIERKTGKIVWRLGPGGDFLPDPRAAEPWFSRQHAPEISSPNHVLIYDNGTASRGYSRVVEYALDEPAKQATLVWEYPGPNNTDRWFSDVMGNATRLPNRNVLIAISDVHSGEIGRFKEVTDQGQKVAEMVIHVSAIGPVPNQPYRAYRIPALVERITH